MRFFRTSPETYIQLHSAVDNMFYNDFIDTGRCKHILPVDPFIGQDSKAYIAVPDWMGEAPGAENFTQHEEVEEITSEQYQAAMPQEDANV